MGPSLTSGGIKISYDAAEARFAQGDELNPTPTEQPQGVGTGPWDVPPQSGAILYIVPHECR
jgi:hypothetical protein